MQVGKVSMSQQVKEFNGFRLSTHEDCHYLKDKLRYADIQEILANSGSTPYNVLLKGYVASEVCFTIVDKKRPTKALIKVEQLLLNDESIA